ncbi:MAG TPA: hypothetical protein VM674_04360 [Candidatus Acidoferrum sp.]|nr:hypothetical protein [Candidatus Acidoferrum sp.]
MPATTESDWVPIYETKSATDADLVRTTLEVAGYEVSVDTAGRGYPPSFGAPATMTISVRADDADDARTFLKEKTSLLPSSSLPLSQAGDDSEQTGVSGAPPESLEDVAREILELRRQHELAACKYCGIGTLDVTELDVDSRMIALLRAAGLGVNSATFSEFQPGERICSDCAGHEVTCELCGRVLDAFIDEGEYRRANDDEAYVCSQCMGRLEDQLQSARDWE